MLSFVILPYAHVSLQPKSKEEGTQQIAMVVHCALHARNHAVKPLLHSLSIHPFLFEANEGAEAEGMLRRVDPSGIIEWTDKPTERDKQLVLRIGIDADAP